MAMRPSLAVNADTLHCSKDGFLMSPKGRCFLAGAAMGFYWHQWVRLTMAGLLALSGVALLVGRSFPTRPARREPGHPSFAYINSHMLGLGSRELLRLDPEAGRIEPLPLPEGEMLDCARGSPWRDSRGRWQVAGLGWTRSGSWGNPITWGYCLALYEFPGGAVLDRVETEDLPAGPLCWEPGTSARVLYAALDGALYWHEFEGSDPSGANDRGGNRRPKRLSWACPPPGQGHVFLADPEWPPESRLGPRLLVSVRVLERVDGLLRRSSWQLWWLRLDRARMAIVAAGPLFRPDPTISAPEPSEEATWGDRFPTLLPGPGGGLAVAYLTYRPGVHEGQLRIAPLRIDPATGEPSARDGGPVLARDCVKTALAPSADGRWICCVVQPEGSGPKVLRLDLAEVCRRLRLGDVVGWSGAVLRPPLPLGRTNAVPNGPVLAPGDVGR
jgi:hypothetical protein